MNLGSSSKKVFGSSKSTKTVKEPVLLKKKFKKKVEPVEDDLDLEDVEDADPEEITKKTVKKTKELALRVAPKLGIQSFEVGDEEFLPENISTENYRDNRRLNDEKVIAASRLPNSNDKRVRGLVTLFGQRSDDILRQLDNEEETDGALTLIHRTLLQTLVDVLPVVERGVRLSKGHRGVIPMNQMVSQIRELVQDIQSLRDRGQMGASIIERVVRPAYLDIASQIAIAFVEIESSSRSRMTPEEFNSHRENLTEVKRTLAKYIHDQYENIKSEVVSSLS